MAKKTIIVLTIALLTFFLLVPFVSYKSLKSALKEEVFNHLVTTRDLLKLQIWNYFNNRFGDIDTLSRNPVISQGFTRLSVAFRTYNFGSSQFQKIENLYLNVAQIFKRGLEDVTFEDYTWNDKVNEYTAYFAAPVYDVDKLSGVLIIEIPFGHLDTMLTQRAGLGQTGEMYLVGEDGLMRSNSRFSVEPTILKKEVDTEATREAFDGYVGKKVIYDYRGVPVLSAYTPLNLNFINWALMVEIDEEEAFASIKSVESRLTIIASIISVIAVGYIYLMYRKQNRSENEYDIPESEEEPESS
jgi:methyl-accepting chemotaxis protein